MQGHTFTECTWSVITRSISLGIFQKTSLKMLLMSKTKRGSSIWLRMSSQVLIGHSVNGKLPYSQDFWSPICLIGLIELIAVVTSILFLKDYTVRLMPNFGIIRPEWTSGYQLQLQTTNWLISTSLTTLKRHRSSKAPSYPSVLCLLETDLMAHHISAIIKKTPLLRALSTSMCRCLSHVYLNSSTIWTLYWPNLVSISSTGLLCVTLTKLLNGLTLVIRVSSPRSIWKPLCTYLKTHTKRFTMLLSSSVADLCPSSLLFLKRSLSYTKTWFALYKTNSWVTNQRFVLVWFSALMVLKRSKSFKITSSRWFNHRVALTRNNQFPCFLVIVKIWMKCVLLMTITLFKITIFKLLNLSLMENPTKLKFLINPKELSTSHLIQLKL